MQVPYKHLDIPINIFGFTVYDVSQEYVVVINNNLPKETQKRFYESEVAKIENGYYTEEVLRCTF